MVVEVLRLRLKERPRLMRRKKEVKIEALIMEEESLIEIGEE